MSLIDLDTLFYLVYGVMLCAFFIMLFAIKAYADGKRWAMPVAFICGICAVTSAFTAILWDYITPKSSILYNRKELRYQKIAYSRLGREVAKRFSGKNILFIRYFDPYLDDPPSPEKTEANPSNHRYPDFSINKVKREAFLQALGTHVNILAEIKVISTMDDIGYYADEFPTSSRYRRRKQQYPEFTAKFFDQLLEQYPQCQVIISFVGLPPDFKTMKFWELSDEKRPALVICDGFLAELQKAIRRGYIDLMLSSNFKRFDYKKPIPEDDNEAFNQRFILISPQNIDELRQKYPHLFRSL